MKKQNYSRQTSDSHRHLESIYQEEESVSKAFQISNFYTNQRLNILELKQRLLEHKKKKGIRQTDKQIKYQSIHSQNEYSIQRTAKFGIQSLQDQEDQHLKNKKLEQQLKDLQQRLSFENYPVNIAAKIVEQSQRSKPIKIEGVPPEEIFDSNPEQGNTFQKRNNQIIKEVTTSNKLYKIAKNQQVKTKTSYGGRKNNITLSPIGRYEQSDRKIQSRLNQYNRGEKIERTNGSKVSEISRPKSDLDQYYFENRIKITTPTQMKQFEDKIHNLWNLYQLLTKIMIGIKEIPEKQKNSIVKYTEDICSTKFEFVKDFINKITKTNTLQQDSRVKVKTPIYPVLQSKQISKQISPFYKRFNKTILISRLLQNLSVVYISIQICKKKKNVEAHLVNFIGYCTSNIIFIIKLMYLAHEIAIHSSFQDDYNKTFGSTQTNLSFSNMTNDILSVIREFQVQSYLHELNNIKDIILRMEHNNQIIGIVQNKLCSKMNKDFQKVVNNYLKYVQRDQKPLFQYGHYIFEFLAYYLNLTNQVGNFNFVQIAPSPYFSLKKDKTIVIQPWEVLFSQKNKHTYIRAYTQLFIQNIAKYCNVVYWTDLMPLEIDDLLTHLPSGQNIYKLYKYHCRYENQKYLKLLWRLGCNTENVIIIDRCEDHFKYDKDCGIELPWKCERKDSKLMLLFGLLEPLIRSQKSLKMGLIAIKRQLESLKSKKKQGAFQKKKILQAHYNNEILIERFKLKNGIRNLNQGQNMFLYPQTISQNKLGYQESNDHEND